MWRAIQPESAVARRSRTGAALIIALICVLLVSMIAMMLVRTALLQLDQLTQEEQWMQADWLAESALSLSAARLRDNPTYAGEIWLPQSSGPSASLGRVVIEVAASGEPKTPSSRRIRVVVDVPDDPVKRVRVTRECRLTLADSSSAGSPATVDN